jgi:hypothetical protein
VTLPPPTGSDAGDEVSMHELGGGGATGTVTVAAGAAPLPFAAVTENVEVEVTVVDTDGWSFGSVTRARSSCRRSAPPPLAHAAVSVTLPPPAGSDAGDEVSVQEPGGGAATVTVTGPMPETVKPVTS